MRCLQNVKLNNLKLYSKHGVLGTTAMKSRRITLAMSHTWGRKKFLQILVWKREENKQFGSRRRTYKSNIKMDLKVMVCEAVSWFKLTQNRLQ
jgi:hypothetical protein